MCERESGPESVRERGPEREFVCEREGDSDSERERGPERERVCVFVRGPKRDCV